MNLTARIAALFSPSGSRRNDSGRSAAMPAVSRGSKGTSAPSRTRALLAVLALALAGLAITAAPALAAPTVSTPVVSGISYTTAQVSSEVTTDAVTTFTAYQFQVSTNGTDWTPNAEGNFFQAETLNAELTGLEDGTHYFVRLAATKGFGGIGNPPEVLSPTPDPSFTTLTASPPTIPGAVEASDIFSTSATGESEVERPETSDDARCRFEYVTDAEFGSSGFTGATVRQCDQNPIGVVDAGTPKKVTAALGCTNPVTEAASGACLEPGTAYRLRLVAETAGGEVSKEAASIFTTAPAVAKPTVLATDDATAVGQNTATVSGEVQRPAGADPALDTDCRFEYVTQAEWEAASDAFPEGAPAAPCAESPITAASADGEGKQKVGAELGGLKPATTYHLRLVAENGGGTDSMVAADTFTTPEAEKPIVTIDPVEDGTFTTAHVSGMLEVSGPPDRLVRPFFQISSDGGASWSTVEGGSRLVGEVGPHFLVQHDYTGLEPSTTYIFRILGSYGFVELPEAEANGEVDFSPEPNPSITTEPPQPAPTAKDLAVTNITATSAHLSASVDPHAPAGPLSELGKKTFATHWEFICTPECKDANGNPIAGTVQGEEGAQTVAGDAKRLDPNTPYEVSLAVSSEGGGETVGPVPFSTPLIKPTVKAAPGGSDGKGGYTLQATVNPNGSEVSSCEFKWGPNSASYAFSAPCSPMPGDKAQPVTVEAHLTGLNPGVVYNYDLFATNAAGTSESGNQEFTPTLDPAESCANRQIRIENNSLALPECRAYEMVTLPDKEGTGAHLEQINGGQGVMYESRAGNLVKSGQNQIKSFYVALRSEDGWKTIPNLNGSSGSIFDAPSNVLKASSPYFYSKDLLSSLWLTDRAGDPVAHNPDGSWIPSIYLRNPDGTFTYLGGALRTHAGVSNDLSHVVLWREPDGPFIYGPGMFEFVGTDHPNEPRRVDLDNTGSPISTCGSAATAVNDRPLSGDGRVIVFTAFGGCGGANPPANELWARVDGTTSINVSASQCNRAVGDPDGTCNGPVGNGGCSYTVQGVEVSPGCRGLTFQAATPDGSRIFFTTRQQLLDADTDETNDVYACDIPAGTPAPTSEKANHCVALMQVSGASPNAEVDSVIYERESGIGNENNIVSRGSNGFLAASNNGSSVLFTAKGVLAGNEDAFGEEPVAGDHNLYAWRTDAAHPDGQTTFVGRLDSDDLNGGAQATPDGRYLVFTTVNRLLDTDTDNARDAYRYDADTEELTRVSTNVFGVAGNGDGFDVRFQANDGSNAGSVISDDGQKIVFTTTEALSPLDGNGEPDVYLWTPARVFLISTGSSGSAPKGDKSTGQSSRVVIDPSGQNIYFESDQQLTPADGDDVGDVYDARIGGGFSFAQSPPCTGETCRPPVSPPPALEPPETRKSREGNPTRPRPCPKGKVRKHGKCVKKSHKRHSGKKHHGKKAGHNRGGGK